MPPRSGVIYPAPRHVPAIKINLPIDLDKESHLKSQRAGGRRKALPELGVCSQDRDVGPSVAKSLSR